MSTVIETCYHFVAFFQGKTIDEYQRWSDDNKELIAKKGSDSNIFMKKDILGSLQNIDCVNNYVGDKWGSRMRPTHKTFLPGENLDSNKNCSR